MPDCATLWKHIINSLCSFKFFFCLANVRLSVNWGVVCPHFPVEPSPQTSTNVLWAVRNQEQDFCSQGPSLVQDQESEGSDTSSCLDSDVTVDYIEDYSSSPEHWTLCATQDFSAS